MSGVAYAAVPTLNVSESWVMDNDGDFDVERTIVIWNPANSSRLNSVNVTVGDEGIFEPFIVPGETKTYSTEFEMDEDDLPVEISESFEELSLNDTESNVLIITLEAENQLTGASNVSLEKDLPEDLRCTCLSGAGDFEIDDDNELTWEVALASGSDSSLKVKCVVEEQGTITFEGSEVEVVSDTLFYDVDYQAITKARFSVSKQKDYPTWYSDFSFVDTSNVPLDLQKVDLWATAYSDPMGTRVYEEELVPDVILYPNESWNYSTSFVYEGIVFIWSEIFVTSIFDVSSAGNTYSYETEEVEVEVTQEDLPSPTYRIVTIGEPGLYLDVRSSIEVHPGEVAKLNVTLANTGDYAVSGINLTSSHNWTYFDQTYIDYLKVNEGEVLELTIKAPTEPGDYEIKLNAEGQNDDAHDVLLVKVGRVSYTSPLKPIIKVVKRLESIDGDRYRVTLIVVNLGDEPIENLTISDPLSPDVSLVSYDSQYFSIAEGKLLLHIDEILPLDSFTRQYVLRWDRLMEISEPSVDSEGITMITREIIYSSSFSMDYPYSRDPYALREYLLFAIFIFFVAIFFVSLVR